MNGSSLPCTLAIIQLVANYIQLITKCLMVENQQLQLINQHYKWPCMFETRGQNLHSSALATYGSMQLFIDHSQPHNLIMPSMYMPAGYYYIFILMHMYGYKHIQANWMNGYSQMKHSHKTLMSSKLIYVQFNGIDNNWTGTSATTINAIKKYIDQL